MHLYLLGIKRIQSVYVWLWLLQCALIYLNSRLQLCGSTELQAGSTPCDQFNSPFFCTDSALALMLLAAAETALQVPPKLPHVPAVEGALCQPGISSVLQECSELRRLSTFLAAFFFAILCRVKLLEPIQSCSRELS